MIKQGLSATLLVVSIVLFCMIVTEMSPFLPDDSFITFRYSENFAKGYGITFNEGEDPVEGYSNFLWLLLCALAVKMRLDLVCWGPRMSLFFGVACFFLFWLILRRHLTVPKMIIPMALLATSAPFALYSASAMETPLYVFLFLAALYCTDNIFADGRMRYYSLLATTCVLLFLCRPEGAAVYPFVACSILFYSYQSNKPARFEKVNAHLAISTATFVILLIGYHLWRISYFGELLPTSFLSKGGHQVSFLTALKVNYQFYFIKQNRYFAPFGFYYVALVLLAGIWLVAGRAGKSSIPQANISFLLSIAYIGVYSYFVDWMPGMRYHSGLIGLFLIPAISLKALDWKKHRGRILVTTILGVISVAGSCYGVVRLKVDAALNEESTVECLIPLGQWLRKSMPNDALLAIHDVGAVPYYARLRTLDSNPQSLTDLYIAKNGFSADYFFSRNPEIAIFSSERSLKRRIFFPHYTPMLKDPRFEKTFRLIGITQYDRIKRSFWVYLRRDLQISLEDMKAFPKGLVP